MVVGVVLSLYLVVSIAKGGGHPSHGPGGKEDNLGSCVTPGSPRWRPEVELEEIAVPATGIPSIKRARRSGEASGSVSSSKLLQRQWRAVRRELERSISEYDQASSLNNNVVANALNIRNEHRFLLWYNSNLYISIKHLNADKHKPHYLFSTLLSIGERGYLPNFISLWDLSAQGEKCNQDFSQQSPPPCLAIAKVHGYHQHGILVPNPYFAHLSEWHDRITHNFMKREEQISTSSISSPENKASRIMTRTIPNSSSHLYFAAAAKNEKIKHKNGVAGSRVELKVEPKNGELHLDQIFWRGKVVARCDLGNKARFEALRQVSRQDILQNKNLSSLFNIKWVESLEAPCVESTYFNSSKGKAMLEHVRKITQGEYVHVSNFSKYKLLLNLPGSMGGSYSRHLNYLWSQGSAILMWQSKHVEWYYPGLKACTTHLVVDKNSFLNSVQFLIHHPTILNQFSTNSLTVAQAFISADGIDRYWRNVVAKLRKHFYFDATIDDQNIFIQQLSSISDCTHLRKVVFKPNITSFYHDDYTPTPHGGHPCEYKPLDSSDPLFRLCLSAKQNKNTLF